MGYNFKYDSYLISIIVPCYNQGQYLNRCLQSIFNQSEEHWECIIIDDGSEDITQSIAEEWVDKDKRFSYYYRRHGGPSAARNDGLKVIKGNSIFFIDGDDALTHNQVLECFIAQNEDDYDVIIGGVNCEYKDRLEPCVNLNPCTHKTILRGEHIIWGYLKQKITSPAWNRLYKTQFLFDNHLSFEEGILHEDELWSIDVYSKANKVLMFPDITYNYNRANPNSIIATSNTIKFDSLVFILSTFKDRLFKAELTPTQKRLVINHFSYLSQFLTKKELISNPELWINYYAKVQKVFFDAGFDLYSKKFKLEPSRAFELVKKLQHVDKPGLPNRITNKIKYESRKFII